MLLCVYRNNICLSCPWLTHTALCVMAGAVPSDFLCVCVYKNVDVMKLARITVLERRSLTFVHAQTITHACTHTYNKLGEDGCRGWVFLSVCECV